MKAIANSLIPDALLLQTLQPAQLSFQLRMRTGVSPAVAGTVVRLSATPLPQSLMVKGQKTGQSGSLTRLFTSQRLLISPEQCPSKSSSLALLGCQLSCPRPYSFSAPWQRAIVGHTGNKLETRRRRRKILQSPSSKAERKKEEKQFFADKRKTKIPHAFSQPASLLGSQYWMYWMTPQCKCTQPNIFIN